MILLNHNHPISGEIGYGGLMMKVSIRLFIVSVLALISGCGEIEVQKIPNQESAVDKKADQVTKDILNKIKNLANDYVSLSKIQETKIVRKENENNTQIEWNFEYSIGEIPPIKTGPKLKKGECYIFFQIITYDPDDEESKEFLNELSAKAWSTHQTEDGRSYAIWYIVTAEDSAVGKELEKTVTGVISNEIKKLHSELKQ